MNDQTMTAHEDRELIVITNPYDMGFCEYQGTRAQLEAEGVIPDDLEWPCKARDVTWEAGRFQYCLSRARPPGMKGPMRAWKDGDWWHLRWRLIDGPTDAQREIQRKQKELAEMIHRQSLRGMVEREAGWKRYWKALEDKQFQAFKGLVPGLVPPKRGRRPKQA